MKIVKASSAWLLAIALLVPAVAFAQNDGRFTGVVLDPSGAVIPGATVTVRNERTGEERSVTSAADGRYIVSSLRPSVYTVRAKFGDLAPLEFTGMQLVASQEFALDLSLTAAGVTETVTVVGRANVIDLSSAKIGVNVSEREVQGLPVNGRQMSQLMLQAPGSQNAGTGTWGDIRFSGRAVEQNVIKYDGIEASGVIDSAPGVANGENASLFKLQASLENVQEFRVESSGYPAEYGTGTGGQVSVITKSGGNQFHGSIFEYLRNDKMDARNSFDLTKPALRMNQFGGSVGGPIVKDRVFFFGSFEGYRLRSGVNLIEAVPSAASKAIAVPAVQSIIDAFRDPRAVLLPGASTDPKFDIVQLVPRNTVNENSSGIRL